jgi:glycosyltransferase involved in cell wall biosynthesis
MKRGVSVVIPIFGDTHHETLPAAVDSVLAQRNVEREVIVSEQGACPRWRHLGGLPGVEYVFSNGEGNSSAARNEGLKRASNEFVYLTDADIVFLDEHYLRDVAGALGRGQVFTRVAMRRMLKEEVPGFLELHERYGIENAIRCLELRGKYQATLSESSPPLEEVEYDDRVFTGTRSEIASYGRDPDYMHGRENFLFQRTVHCGMTLARTRDVLAVGGYSVDYPVCVYEDSDLHWKLRSRFDVREIGDRMRDKIMHLDHELSYRSPAFEAANKAIFDARKDRGAKDCIEEDVARF